MTFSDKLTSFTRTTSTSTIKREEKEKPRHGDSGQEMESGHALSIPITTLNLCYGLRCAGHRLLVVSWNSAPYPFRVFGIQVNCSGKAW